MHIYICVCIYLFVLYILAVLPLRIQVGYGPGLQTISPNHLSVVRLTGFLSSRNELHLFLGKTNFGSENIDLMKLVSAQPPLPALPPPTLMELSILPHVNIQAW